MQQPKGTLDWFVTEWLAGLGAGAPRPSSL
jgi:hypothetical protein